MGDDTTLRPATVADIEDALAFALRFDGRKRVHNGDEFMAQITAQRLAEHLARSGFVALKKPPPKLLGTPSRRSDPTG